MWKQQQQTRNLRRKKRLIQRKWLTILYFQKTSEDILFEHSKYILHFKLCLDYEKSFDFFFICTQKEIFSCFSRNRPDSFSRSRQWVIAAFYLRKQPLKGRQSSEKKNIAWLSCSIFREVIIICLLFLPALLQTEGSTNTK